MSRIPELTPDNATPEQRAVMEEIISGPHGRIVGPYPAWLQSPQLARRIRGVSEYIRFQSSLPKRLSELAILIAGRHWKAEFEFYAHSRLARQAGVEEPIIAALAAGQRPELSDPDDVAVYDVCSELLATRRVSDATYARAVERLGLRAVVEVVATIGYYSLVSLTLNAFEIPLPEGEASPFPD